MVTLRIVCLLLLVASGRTDPPHPQDHAVADTIYRETVALDGSAGHGTPVVAHGGSLGHGARHGGAVTKDASVVSHGTPVVSHGVPVVSHGVPVVNHGVPIVSHGVPAVSHGVPAVSHGVPAVSHGVPAVSHGVPVVAHSGSVNFGAPIVAHGASTGYDATVVAHGDPVNHGTPVVAHGGSVGHIVPVVSHGGSVGHNVPVVGHGGLASHTGLGGPITSHGVSVGHGSPVVSHSGAVGHALEVHDPVVKGAVISHGSGYQEPVRSQYHAQDAYGRYSFGYNAGTSARDETRDAYGNVHGSYTYVDSYGNLQTQHYIAGKDGFQVEGTNLPVQVSHEQRYKRSYAVFPASTEPLGSGVPSGHVTTVTRHQQGPVVADLPGPYGGPRGYGSKVVYQPPVVPNEGLIHANAYGVSPLLGKANLHGNFDKLSYNGFSYGFETGPSSLATYGTHFNQHIPQYSH